MGMNGSGGEIVEVQGGHIVRSSSRNDRHSKVYTSRGPRDRRVRLSAPTAIKFYDVQDRLGYDRPSKAVDWLLEKARIYIDQLAELPPWHPPTAAPPAEATLDGSPGDYGFKFPTQTSNGGNSLFAPDPVKCLAPKCTPVGFPGYPPAMIPTAEDLCLSLNPFGPGVVEPGHDAPNGATLFPGPGAPMGFESCPGGWSVGGFQRMLGWENGDRTGFVLNSQPPAAVESAQFSHRRAPLQRFFSAPIPSASSEHTDKGTADRSAAAAVEYSSYSHSGAGTGWEGP